MGQAKRRGTYEQRRESAIERDKIIRERMAEYDRLNPIQPSGMSTNERLMLAYVFAMAEVIKKSRWI